MGLGTYFHVCFPLQGVYRAVTRRMILNNGSTGGTCQVYEKKTDTLTPVYPVLKNTKIKLPEYSYLATSG